MVARFPGNAPSRMVFERRGNGRKATNKTPQSRFQRNTQTIYRYSSREWRSPEMLAGISLRGRDRAIMATKPPRPLLAGPADTECVRNLLNLAPSPAVPEMLKILTNAPLLEVARQLQQCRCYLGIDSGITHLAALRGVPAVAIFGPSDPVVWRPVGPSVKVIQERALEDVPVDVIMEAIDSFYVYRT